MNEGPDRSTWRPCPKGGRGQVWRQYTKDLKSYDRG